MIYFSYIRARAVVGLTGALFAALLGRVAYLQTYGREATISRADRQQHLVLTLQARRGDIYDRNGLLAAPHEQVVLRLTVPQDPAGPPAVFNGGGCSRSSCT